jgi:hypothetical protein
VGRLAAQMSLAIVISPADGERQAGNNGHPHMTAR